jgi:hypothetical protein
VVLTRKPEGWGSFSLGDAELGQPPVVVEKQFLKNSWNRHHTGFPPAFHVRIWGSQSVPTVASQINRFTAELFVYRSRHQLTPRMLPAQNGGLWYRAAGPAMDLGDAGFEMTLLRKQLIRCGCAVIHLRAVHSQRATVIEHEPIEAERTSLRKGSAI